MRRRAFLTGSAALLSACASPAPQREIEGELLSTWEPTPHPVVRKMLEMAQLQPGELLYDLGSGDGRIVIAAAEEFRAQALGFEIDRDLAHLSQKAIRSKRLSRLARVVPEDLMTADYSKPDVVACYLTPEGLAKVTPKLEAEMRPGTRLVAYKFPIPGWTPVQTETMKDPDPNIPLHEIFLYHR
ncbi:MAG: class I SAM-dependent methyltransferase [Bryobacterales bacterium]|nr:class I SAM-dependent methyltransferase [Acidobacteriota bacterium]MCB9383371.1 class I SAM-dependent methyltransferase [Bryobacterales bacterium]